MYLVLVCVLVGEVIVHFDTVLYDYFVSCILGYFPNDMALKFYDVTIVLCVGVGVGVGGYCMSHACSDPL